MLNKDREKDLDNYVLQITPINSQECDAISLEGIPNESLKDLN